MTRAAECRNWILCHLRSGGPQTATELRLDSGFTVCEIQNALRHLAFSKIQRTPITEVMRVRIKNKGIRNKSSIAFCILDINFPKIQHPRKIKLLTERVSKKILINENDCHVWQGKKNGMGYGRIDYMGRYLYVHRVTYEMKNGSIPVGLVIDHLCRNTSCCNPEHLEAVTNEENFRRGAEGGGAIQRAKTHCKYGHEFTSENTIPSRGIAHHRQCKTCRNEQARNRRRAKREAAQLS